MSSDSNSQPPLTSGGPSRLRRVLAVGLAGATVLISAALGNNSKAPVSQSAGSASGSSSPRSTSKPTPPASSTAIDIPTSAKTASTSVSSVAQSSPLMTPPKASSKPTPTVMPKPIVVALHDPDAGALKGFERAKNFKKLPALRKANIPVDYAIIYAKVANPKKGFDWATLAAVGQLETTNGLAPQAWLTSAPGDGPKRVGPLYFETAYIADWEKPGKPDFYNPEKVFAALAKYLNESLPDGSTEADVFRVLGIAQSEIPAEKQILAYVVATAAAYRRDVPDLAFAIAHPTVGNAGANPEL